MDSEHEARIATLETEIRTLRASLDVLQQRQLKIGALAQRSTDFIVRYIEFTDGFHRSNVNFFADWRNQKRPDLRRVKAKKGQ